MPQARKCKHCGEWLQRQCPHCGEWVNAKAVKCKHCKGAIPADGEKDTAKPAEPQTVYVDRGGAEMQAVLNEMQEREDDKSAGCVLYGELIMFCIIAGFGGDMEWWETAIVFVIAVVLLQVRFLRVLYAIGMVLLWGALGLELSGWGAALVAGFVALALHGQMMRKGFTGI